MTTLLLPALWAIVSLLTVCVAQTQCPTQPPSGACSQSTFASALSPFGASIEKISVVPAGGCYREPPANNTAFGNTGRDNFAANVGGSCALIVKSGSVGNFAFSGGINWIDMGPGPSVYGMATMSTDTGHSSPESDMSWAKGNVQAQEDWGFRAMNGSVVIAKKLTDAYYGQFGRELSFSYYSGCSTGGRQGLKQIQISQTSFNGLLIGAPAWEQYHLMPWIAKLGSDYANAGANGSFSQNQWIGVTVQIRQACDLNDTVADNIISRPDHCSFDAIAADYLQCGGRFALQQGYCLNQNQIPTAAQFYKDYVIGTKTVFRGPELGSEVDLGLSGGYLTGTDPTTFDMEWAKDFLGYPDNYVYSDSMVSDAETQNPGMATADSFNLGDFSQNRGKIIMYQGLADGIIPAKGTTYFYEQTKSQTTGNIDSFLRYFQVPGMHHCWLSDTDADPAGANAFAPWMFGGAGQAGIVTASEAAQVLGKPEFDALEALRQWVEAAATDQNAPGPASITATTWFTGNQTVWRQRPLCPYGQIAALTPGAEPNNKSSWTCQTTS